MSQLEAIIIKTPPKPRFSPLIDQLMKMDPDLEKVIKKYSDDKDTQIIITMRSETEYILELLRDGRFEDAMKARYRMLFCAEVERQKLAAYETTTRQQLIARFITVSQDIVDLSNLIAEMYPRHGVRDGSRYSPEAVVEALKHKTNLDIHNRTGQLWYIDCLKREVLKGNRAALDRMKVIESRRDSWENFLTGFIPRPYLQKQPSTGTDLDAIPEVPRPENLVKENEDPRFSMTPTASTSGKAEISKETLPGVETEAQSSASPKREGSFGKRTVSNFQNRWRKLQTKFGTPSSGSGEKNATSGEKSTDAV
ncbi:hypothetical protein TWF481_009869 [Arthrobotrys musiformis]|uniref:Uncharacterized protein n=1 Tax=Arthrobotrys musiformis TaxID=47236 RepID=A0AAV9W533_9PEZI